jgi:AAA15 family ATPase/GTPase
MVTDTQKWHKDHIYRYGDLELLKTAALYGANGAGKSNLIKGISFLRNLVIKGDWNPVTDLKVFKLDPSCENLPTSFEIEFVKNSRPFIYGLSLLNHSIIDEWLLESGVGKGDRKLFSRKTENGETKIDLSEDFLKNDQDRIRIQLYQTEFLKEYTPFLKLISESKESFSEIKEAYEWFKTNLLVMFPKSRFSGFAERLNRSPKFERFANELICSFHTGISKVEVTQYDLDQFFGKDDKETADEIRKGLKLENQIVPLRSPGYKEELIAVLEGGRPVIKRIINKHANKSGQLFDFLIDEESDGTVRLFDLIPAIYTALSAENTVIVDEIDQSIHPALLKELIRKFCADNTTKGQLIFTTHESNLLDQDIFRRDEIWFVEKDKDGETSLSPLSDYEIRADLDIRKGYLVGRFGAIPFLSNLQDLNWDKYAEAEQSL